MSDRTSTGATPDTIGLRAAAELLGVHYMTAYRYVRTGRLEARLVDQEWRIAPATVEAFRSAPNARPGRRGPLAAGAPDPTFAVRLEAQLVNGDEIGAWQVVESAMHAGADPSAVHLHLITPALRAVGDAWVDGRITIADEHIASATAARIIGRLGPRFATRGPKRATVVLGCAPGDRHGFATVILADLLRARGFQPVDLGPDTPADSFVVATTRYSRVLAVAVSASTTQSARRIHDVTRALRSGGYPGTIVAGGSAVPSPAAARTRGADSWAADGSAFVRLVEDLATTAPDPVRQEDPTNADPDGPAAAPEELGTFGTPGGARKA